VLLAVWASLNLLMLSDKSGHSLWWLVHALPGGSGVRAVGRVGFFTLFCSALMVGQIVTWLEERKRWIWPALLTVFIVVEGAVDNRYLFSIASHQQRTAAVQQDLQPHPACAAFVLESPQNDFRSYAVQLDAMWASSKTGIPTLNGWAGATPPGWDFRGRAFPSDEAAAWVRRYRGTTGEVCVLPEIRRN
jgi:hypothetical protein